MIADSSISLSRLPTHYQTDLEFQDGIGGIIGFQSATYKVTSSISYFYGNLLNIMRGLIKRNKLEELLALYKKIYISFVDKE
jgi:hypothetical protein